MLDFVNDVKRLVTILDARIDLPDIDCRRDLASFQSQHSLYDARNATDSFTMAHIRFDRSNYQGSLGLSYEYTGQCFDFDWIASGRTGTMTLDV